MAIVGRRAAWCRCTCNPSCLPVSWRSLRLLAGQIVTSRCRQEPTCGLGVGGQLNDIVYHLVLELRRSAVWVQNIPSLRTPEMRQL